MQKEINKIIRSFINAMLATAIALFLPARTFLWWQAWVFIILFFLPMFLITVYLISCSPDLLKRRLEIKEKSFGQNLLAKMFYISVSSVFIISGLDKYYGWSHLSVTTIIISEVIFLGTYFFLFLVFKENQYLAHTVTVEEKQEVVVNGPYKLVRHPMYFAELLMFILAAFALGSYWALLADLVLLSVLIIRIITEEEVLIAKLKGYSEYTKKTRFRLIPGIW